MNPTLLRGLAATGAATAAAAASYASAPYFPHNALIFSNTVSLPRRLKK